MRFNLTVLLLLLTIPLYSQNDSVTLSDEYYQMGMDIFDYEHRKQASELFILSTKANPKNAKAHFMAGQSIMLSLIKGKSLPYFRKAYQLNSQVDPDIFFHLGKAYHYAELFDSALYFYNLYSQQVKERDTNPKKINELNRKISECNNAKLMKDYPANVTITNLGNNINSEFPDYAPATSENDQFMIFTSRRPDENKSAQVAGDHEYYEEIFFSRKENNDWLPAHSMENPLNTSYHNASISISPDGKEILLYNDTNGGDIFVTYLQANGKWTIPVGMEGVNTPYIENSASLTADKNTLYFTSNRPGGIGGTDIYRCTKDSKGNWKNPENLGALINTELDEEAVFISADGRYLYFSSNGHLGMGDLDIYQSAYDEVNKIWSKPVNMGYPINSVENDIYFVLSGTEGIAYFSSVREPSLGEEDIYKIDISKWKPGPYTQVDFEDLALAKKDSTLKKSEAQSAIAKPSAEIYATNDAVSDSVSESDTIKKPIIPDAKPVDKIALNETRKLNIYFNTNSAVPKSLDDVHFLEQLMKSSPTIKVEIIGHTDNTGTAEYNLTLSKRRAAAIKKYLVASGIEESRITTIGYGLEKPVADNNSREGRQLNRRTEFKITEN
jgi:outer membrane protein OmpA-like peptidoglycan-associated protein